MKLTVTILSLALLSQTTLAAWGLSKAIYNKWEQTELERWLADHNIPYPEASDRKSLESLVKDNWDGYVVSPYEKWDTKQQANWLSKKGVEVSDKQADNANWLNSQIKKKWYETESSAEEGYGDAKSWVFDTWTESQLKSFLDYHSIPSPKARTRDAYLSTARSNYATVANKAGESAAYPGDWVFKQWSDSDLKKWLDEHGYKSYQGSKRNELIAAVRSNSRQANLKVTDVKDSVAASVFGSWSDSELKKWFDKNNIPVPQNGKRDELIALARKNQASLTGDTYSASYTAALKSYGSATGVAAASWGSATDAAAASGKSLTDAAAASAASLTDAAYASGKSATDAAGSYAAAATDAAYDQAVGAKDTIYDKITGTYHSLADKALETWSESRLKGYLDARGVPVPQNGKKDELVALARLHKYKAAHAYNVWTFDTWTTENIKKWLQGQGQSVKDTTTANRDELVSSANVAYASASSAGGDVFASVTSALTAATGTVKDSTFDTWSDSDLKAYLDSYGVSTYQGTTKNDLVAKARRCQKVFKDGWTQETAFQRYQRQFWGAVQNLIGYGSQKSSEAAAYGEKYASSASSVASSATSAAKQEL